MKYTNFIYNKKIIITKMKNYNSFINKKEYEIIPLDFDINEGKISDTWSTIKYKASKLGSITKGGKLFGRSDIDKESMKQIEEMLNKAGNEKIKELTDSIKKQYPEFPNTKSREDFLNGLSVISTAYDSIKSAYEKTVNENINSDNDNYVSLEMANSLIKNLRMYLKRLIDYDLSTSYTVFENIEIYDEYEYIEYVNEMNSYNELYEKWYDPKTWFKKKDEQTLGTEQAPTPVSKNSNPINVQDTESATKKTLNDKKAEKILIALGAALGVLGWVAQSDWFHELLKLWLDKPATPTIIQKNISSFKYDVKPGEGITQVVNRIIPGANIGPNSTSDQILSILKGKGFGNTPGEIIQNLGIGSTSGNLDFNDTLQKSLNSPNILKDLFSGNLSGLGGSLLEIKPGPFIAKRITGYVVKQLGTAAVTTGTSAVGIATTVGPILAGVGIALIVAGVTSWLLKRKSLKSSRYKDLQGLLEQMVLLTPFVKPVNPQEEPNIQIEEEQESKQNRSLDYIKLLKLAGIDFNTFIGTTKLPLFGSSEIESLFNPKMEKYKQEFIKTLKNSKTTLTDEQINSLFTDKTIISISKFAVGNRKGSGKDSFVYRLCQQFPELGTTMTDDKYIKKFNNTDKNVKGESGVDKNDYTKIKSGGDIKIENVASSDKSFKDRINDTFKYVNINSEHAKTLKSNFPQFLKSVKSMYSKFNYDESKISNINSIKESFIIKSPNDFKKLKN